MTAVKPCPDILISGHYDDRFYVRLGEARESDDGMAAAAVVATASKTSSESQPD